MRKFLFIFASVSVLLAGFHFGGWVSESGRPTGGDFHELANVRGHVYSMFGVKRASLLRSERVALLHLVVLEPKVAICGETFDYQGEGLTASETFGWILWDKENELPTGSKATFDVTYDGAKDRVFVGPRSYDLSQGNLFVVRLDEEWSPSVLQVEAVVSKRMSLEQVLQEFKRALPHHADVRKAALSEDPLLRMLMQGTGDLPPKGGPASSEAPPFSSLKDAGG
jgi:hypothetical protein